MIGTVVALQDMETSVELVRIETEAETVTTDGTEDETTIVTENVTDATTTVVHDMRVGTEDLIEVVTVKKDLLAGVMTMQWLLMDPQEETEGTAVEVDEAEVKGVAVVKRVWAHLNAEVPLLRTPFLCQ